MGRISPYSPQFRMEAVQLVHTSGKSMRAVARDLGIPYESLRNWVNQSQEEQQEGMTASEREELKRLRKEIRILQEEREILKKAAAFFAKENESTR